MQIDDDFSEIIEGNYYGRILPGDYSRALKIFLAECIKIYSSFERTGNLAIPYISAWEDEANEIWYEFVGQDFADLLGCERSEVAAVFRDSILDRRIYKYLEKDESIEKEIFNKTQLNSRRRLLRDDVKDKGIIDAVYKISLGGDKIIWLKDMAKVRSYIQDDIYLSLGSLTVVTKEMRAEEERVQREKLQALLETAGAVCHELNQPFQAIMGYSELLLMQLEKDDPLYEKIVKISDMTKRMGEITKKLRKITRYETKDYLQGIKIVDIDRSSKE